MIRILANDGVHADAIMLLEEAEYQVDTERVPQDKLASVLNQYDALIVRSATKVRQQEIDAAPNLKIIVRGGVGLDNIDVAYAESKGIKVINTPKSSSQAVAELVFAHMFSLARQLHLSNREMPTRGATDFKKLKDHYSDLGFQLRGRTLGVLGFGRIGQEVARIGLGLGMNVVPVDLVQRELKLEVELYKLQDAALSVTMRTVTMEEMLPQADFITIHIPFTGGKSILGKDQFERMKKGVVLINTSRGGAINESELLEALESGRVMAAGLDVFVDEPMPRTDLLNHPRISVTPHIGASTVEAQAKIGLEIADILLEFFGGTA
jgi:D-3-phosphoglycerate dehydrogenase